MADNNDKLLTSAERDMVLKDWLRLVEFGDKAVQYQSEIGRVLDSMDIAREPCKRDAIKAAKRLSDVSDVRFFSLGPVYVTCNVPFDIMGEFKTMLIRNKTPYDGPRLVLNFNKPVFAGLQAWDNVLEGLWLGPDGYDRLVKFMTTQRIRQKTTGAYWGVKHVEVAIPDPMLVDNRLYDHLDPSKTVIIGVFLPTGNRYQLGVNTPRGVPPVKFTRYSPDQAIVTEGQTMLQVG